MYIYIYIYICSLNHDADIMMFVSEPHARPCIDDKCIPSPKHDYLIDWPIHMYNFTAKGQVNQRPCFLGGPGGGKGKYEGF